MIIDRNCRIKRVTTLNGYFTDVWLDGCQSRLVGHLTLYDAIIQIDRVRDAIRRG